MDFRYYLGIDPDTDKSGVALWDKWEQKFVFITNMDFWTLVEFIKTGHAPKFGDIEGWAQINFIVIIDAGWLLPVVNFHTKVKRRDYRDKLCVNIGRNHQTGIILSDFCKRYGFNYSLHEPSGKINQIAFRNITGWKATTNQDQRDAGMLVYKK